MKKIIANNPNKTCVFETATAAAQFFKKSLGTIFSRISDGEPLSAPDGNTYTLDYLAQTREEKEGLIPRTINAVLYTDPAENIEYWGLAYITLAGALITNDKKTFIVSKTKLDEIVKDYRFCGPMPVKEHHRLSAHITALLKEQA